LVQEMANLVSVLSIGDGNFGLTLLEEHPLMAPDFKGNLSKSAEIVITPDGEHIMASTRGFGEGTNTIVLFKTMSNGRLSFAHRVNSGTHYPRGMEVGPDGTTLFVAGQSSANLVSFTIGDTLTPTGLNFTGIQTPTSLGFSTVQSEV